MERLDKILSSQGVGSRKEAGILIRRGLVHVNGILATRPETKTDPERDQITIEGKPLRFQRHVYLMMNKQVINKTSHRNITKLINAIGHILAKNFIGSDVHFSGCVQYELHFQITPPIYAA